MIRMGGMGQVLGCRVQHGGKLAMILECPKTLAGDAIDRGLTAENTLAHGDIPGSKQPLNAPTKAAPRRFQGRQLRELKELLMGDEAGVSDLDKQRNISACADRMCAFGIPHLELLRRKPGPLEAQVRPQSCCPWRPIAARFRTQSAPNRRAS